MIEDTQSAAVFYDYEKPGGAMKTAQLFKSEDGRIAEVLLIFDRRQLA